MPLQEQLEVLIRAGVGRRVKSPFLKPYPLPNLGSKNLAHGQLLKELMQTPNFRVTVVQEVDTVEICGALKVRGAQGSVGWGAGPERRPSLAVQCCCDSRCSPPILPEYSTHGKHCRSKARITQACRRLPSDSGLPSSFPL